ncbi:MAG: hypothetical protein IKM06_01670, partial [Clostridia bacterium]|nr:hypothetical protein [Clostridia bacterium]
PIVVKALLDGRDLTEEEWASMGTPTAAIMSKVKFKLDDFRIEKMGETGIYRPASIFCRQKYKAGEFGKLVYAEAQYNHDMLRLYDTFRYTEGELWRKMAGLPPFFYPTHSTSMVLSATKAHAVKVSAFGYEDDRDTEIFGKDKNWWGNPFSNSSMLLKMSDNSIVRISENRRIAWHVPETYITSFNGTDASYECSIAQHSFVKMHADGRTFDFEDVSDILNPVEVTKHKNEPDFTKKVFDGNWSTGEAPIQITKRLPKEYEGLSTGHAGTHKFMIDDFCQAYMTGKLSPTNAWQAARYNIPGLTAHECAMRGGATMEVYDCGDPPKELEVLDEDRLENEGWI